MSSATRGSARSGFTLVEVLVTLVLLSLLAVTLLPSVINQLDLGGATRVARELDAIRSGARLFRVDVKRYPSTVEQLTRAPGPAGTGWSATEDLNGAPITDALLTRWNGPYLEDSDAASSTTTLATSLGGEIQPTFGTATLTDGDYLTVRVTGLDSADVQSLSDIIDGDPDIDATTGGRLRMSNDTTVYLAVPIN